MKKLMFMLAISCLVLVMAGSIFACDECQGKVGKHHAPLTLDVDLNAVVHAYAKLQVAPTLPLLFDGSGKQVRGGVLGFALWNNYDVVVKGEGAPFATIYNGTKYTLATSYAKIPGIKADIQNWNFAYPGQNGTNYGAIAYEATTGDMITAQPAGEYKANYKFTVSSGWDNYYCFGGLW